jgi:hypothetical protein
VVGYLGYNVSLLKIVQHRDVSCASAKRLALQDWMSGSAGESIAWRYTRAWRTSSGGSAYIGEFVGTAGHTRVEYLAVH